MEIDRRIASPEINGPCSTLQSEKRTFPRPSSYIIKPRVDIYRSPYIYIFAAINPTTSRGTCVRTFRDAKCQFAIKVTIFN